jgi:predicted site-specific integrase-resolvase
MPTKIAEVTLYSVPELSRIMNVTTMSIRNYIRQGYLKGQKLTGRWFVTEEDFEKFFNKLS